MVQTRLQSGAQMSNGKRKLDIDTETKPTKKQRRSQPIKQESKSEKNTSTKSSNAKPSKTKAKPPQPDIKTNGSGSGSKTIIINRAPVLHLWAACVAQKLHPELSWSTSLSAGAAISTLCAILKGRAIGAIEPKDKDDNQEAKEKRKKREQDAVQGIEVMHFHLQVNKDGKAMVGDKAQSPGADALRRKFDGGGDEGAYERVKSCFDDALDTWKSSDEDELSGRAFKMYEEFRPNVSKGQKGWGRKDELGLETVKQVVSNS